MTTLRNLAAALLLSLVLLDMSTHPVTAAFIGDCCLRYSRKRVPRKYIVGFAEQYSNEICDMNAIIFQTIRGRQICVDPTEQWVKKQLQRLSKRLDELSH